MRLLTLFTRRLGAILACGLAALLAGCAAPRAGSCAPAGPDVACTAEGAVRGVVENGTLAFKGIPYAAPPVGALRWQPPRPPAPWQGVRDATRFGAVCPQLDGQQQVIGSEDCLTVNVWVPQPRPAGPLPVMVFLPGGGNHAFSGQGASVFGGVGYNGQQLVPQGVVFVSFNNRLGALGFLAHASLSGERAERVSGNYGSLDQIALLQWVQKNIASFGGDPRKVMLFGTSAGGGSICALMTAPAARGLFHAAAMHSSVPTGCELQTLAQAQEGSGRQVAQQLGCTGADALACLRGKSTADVVKALPGSFGLFSRVYGPNVDGVVFPAQPLEIIQAGRHAHMPVIVGNSTDETMLWAASAGPVNDAAGLDAALTRLFTAQAVPRIRAMYPLADYASPREAMVRITTDAFFTCQSLRVARALAQQQREPVWRYVFSHSLQNDPELRGQRAVHTVEHVFFFPWQGSYKPTAEDLAVQQRMVGDWSRFARTGAPDAAWRPAGSDDAYLLIAPQPAMRAGANDAKCAFWHGVRLTSPHL
jgi:para-nitrobenzyl esterase